MPLKLLQTEQTLIRQLLKELPDQSRLSLLMETLLYMILQYTSGSDELFLCSMYERESLFI